MHFPFKVTLAPLAPLEFTVPVTSLGTVWKAFLSCAGRWAQYAFHPLVSRDRYINSSFRLSQLASAFFSFREDFHQHFHQSISGLLFKTLGFGLFSWLHWEQLV